ncbi:NUDIX hydrolase [Lysinibacillus boronitolerans]|uniref:DNA mismatch repair protein MutT n=1 Tax=Lysinibacillus boronitolerans JCM 21713 = 10a = NBRC 103108 TaxID=1294264 RepID=A0ABR4XXZ1_9BACI|nr:NUDIX domain-containing protein [Lysinibacillus boronitolerans]KGR83097.1 DNA mismatch repair protein MutT [Lysinibacillus boronitolerans JCM 21713 = 10a = NBRC 103108]
MQTIFVDWGGNNVKLTWMPRLKLTESLIVTSVHAVCFKDGKVLLAQIKNRGFNYPGGHVEIGEKVEEAILRETYEEGYVKGTIKYIGSIEVSHKENLSFDSNGKYPLIAYQAFFRMDVTECLPFLREHESSARIWVEPTEIPFVINDNKLSKLILDDALTFCSS